MVAVLLVAITYINLIRKSYFNQQKWIWEERIALGDTQAMAKLQASPVKGRNLLYGEGNGEFFCKIHWGEKNQDSSWNCLGELIS